MQEFDNYDTQHSQEKDIHAPGGIRTHNLSRRATTNPRLRPRSQRERPLLVFNVQIYRRKMSIRRVCKAANASYAKLRL